MTWTINPLHHWKWIHWDLNVVLLKRKIIRTKPPWLWVQNVTVTFQGVYGCMFHVWLFLDSGGLRFSEAEWGVLIVENMNHLCFLDTYTRSIHIFCEKNCFWVWSSKCRCVFSRVFPKIVTDYFTLSNKNTSPWLISPPLRLPISQSSSSKLFSQRRGRRAYRSWAKGSNRGELLYFRCRIFLRDFMGINSLELFVGGVIFDQVAFPMAFWVARKVS